MQAYNGNNPTNFGGPGFSSPGIGDVIEGSNNPFDTDRVEVSFSSVGGLSTLQLDYYTQFNGNDLSARYADVFFGTDPSNPDTFDHAIALGDQAANGGRSVPGFFDVSGPNGFKTSRDVWASRSSYTYGGQFDGIDANFHDTPTVVWTGAAEEDPLNWSVNVSEGASGDPSYPFRVNVSLTASDLIFNQLFGEGLSVLWGTGDCANDPIEIGIPPDRFTTSTVPEPVSLSIFGAGLLGAAWARRRKRSEKA